MQASSEEILKGALKITLDNVIQMVENDFIIPKRLGLTYRFNGKTYSLKFTSTEEK